MKPKKPHAEPLPMRALLGAIDKHLMRLDPDDNPKPKKRHLTAAGLAARVVNSHMSSLRTSLSAYKIAGKKPELELFELGS